MKTVDELGTSELMWKPQGGLDRLLDLNGHIIGTMQFKPSLLHHDKVEANAGDENWVFIRWGLFRSGWDILDSGTRVVIARLHVQSQRADLICSDTTTYYLKPLDKKLVRWSWTDEDGDLLTMSRAKQRWTSPREAQVYISSGGKKVPLLLVFAGWHLIDYCALGQSV